MTKKTFAWAYVLLGGRVIHSHKIPGDIVFETRQLKKYIQENSEQIFARYPRPNLVAKSVLTHIQGLITLDWPGGSISLVITHPERELENG